MSIAESPPPAAPAAETVGYFRRNFNVPITSATNAPTDTMTIVLPLILFGGGIAGLLIGARLKRTKPDVYAGIGEGG